MEENEESPASQIAARGAVRNGRTSTVPGPGPGSPTPGVPASFHPPQSTVLAGT